MPRNKQFVKNRRLTTKDCWHAYGLQTLSPDKFLRVTESIIQGQILLLMPPRHDQTDTDLLQLRLPGDEGDLEKVPLRRRHNGRPE